MADDETRELLIKDNQGEFKIPIPAEWKVTFSGVNPAEGGFRGNGDALRIYEGKDKQRAACFTNVINFRDLSIPVVRKIARKSGATEWEDDGQGNAQHTERQKVEFEESKSK